MISNGAKALAPDILKSEKIRKGTAMKKIEDYVRSIPDFPEPGIIFRDVTSVLADADGLQLAIDEMRGLVEKADCDVIAGTESRGFIFGMPIAYLLHKPFVLMRDDLQDLRAGVRIGHDRDP